MTMWVQPARSEKKKLRPSPGPRQPRPTLDQFDLPNDLDIDAFKLEHARARTVAGIKAALLMAVPAIYAIYRLYVHFEVEFLSLPSLAILWVSAILAGGIHSVISNWTLSSQYSGPELDNLRAYERATLDWDERELETGRTYWTSKRGIEFEAAVQKLFERRGCRVITTKATGDGGVDLRVQGQGLDLWIQCKGHAKPISVAAIREIAGVCSRAEGEPVVCAVNGFTGPAEQAAKELGVQLLDTRHLIQIARSERL